REQTQSVAIPPEQLDQISTAAAEHEDVTRKRVLLQDRLHDRAQSGEAASQIGHSGGDPDLSTRGHSAHRRSPPMTARTHAGLTEPSIRIRAWPKSMSMTPAAAFSQCFVGVA